MKRALLLQNQDCHFQKELNDTVKMKKKVISNDMLLIIRL